jgi:hypothetical protein
MSEQLTGMPKPPTDGLLPYKPERYMICPQGYPYFLLDYPLWGTWRVTWWLGLN